MPLGSKMQAPGDFTVCQRGLPAKAPTVHLDKHGLHFVLHNVTISGPPALCQTFFYRPPPPNLLMKQVVGFFVCV